MGIDLDRLLVETATRVSTTIDENGDYKYGTTTTEPCLYRDISSLSDSAGREALGADGILWLNAASAVAVGDIYYHSAEGYLKINRRVRAKRLVIDNSTQFYRCSVEHIRQVS